MANNTRALEVLKYLQDGGYSLQDLVEAIETGGELGINKENRIEVKISNMLHELGVPNLKGFQYLTEAIMEVYDNEKIANQFTTVLIPKLAKKHKVTPAAIYKSMKYCNVKAFQTMLPEVREKYFGNIISSNKTRLTNSQLIRILAARLHLEESD